MRRELVKVCFIALTSSLLMVTIAKSSKQKIEDKLIIENFLCNVDSVHFIN